MSDDRDRIAYLEKRLAASERTVRVLMDRLEDRTERADVGVALLEKTVALEAVVSRKTAELERQKSELGEALTRLQLVQCELVQSQKLTAIGQLAAGVAHEINTPIQFVSDSVYFVREAAADLMEALAFQQEVRRSVLAGERTAAEGIARAERREAELDLPYLRENVPAAIARAIEWLERVATIVRSLKDFAHPDRKEMSPVDLGRAIESTLAISRNEYKYVADVETDLGTLPPVVCHAGEINQVLLNIIVNAAHAIGDVVQGTEGRGRITVRARSDGKDVTISISDTGGGIPAAIRDRIYDPFFTTKDVGRGTGQGLAIARSVVVEKHGGELWFESEEGKGTTFHLRLPLVGRAESREVAA